VNGLLEFNATVCARCWCHQLSNQLLLWYVTRGLWSFGWWFTRFNSHINYKKDIYSMFFSVVTGAFQIIFCTKMHVNDIFSFFKNYFWHQHIKTIQTIQIILNFNKKKKNFKFFRNTAAFPNVPLMLQFLVFNVSFSRDSPHNPTN